MKRHLLVDFGTIAYWKLFSLVSKHKGFDTTSKNMFLVQESENEFPNWCDAVDQTLVMLIDRFNPDKLTIACDGPNLWRAKFYPKYKANRKKQRAEIPIDWELFSIIRDEHIKSLAKVFPMKVILKAGIEADDIIAVVTKELSNEEEIIAVTGDGDINQLFRFPNFSVYNPKDNEHITKMDWLDVLNVKILSGDRGDNIDAVKPRVGEGTARKIIKECEGDILSYCSKHNLLDNYHLNQRLINFEMIPKDIYDYIYSEYLDARIYAPDHDRMVLNFSAEYNTIRELFSTKLFKNYIK